MNMYSEYKSTEYDWLGEIPSHWRWLYLSQICNEQEIKNAGNIETNVLSLSYGSIIRKKNIDFGLSPKDYSTYQVVDDGNIILRLTDLQNDHKSLRTGLVRERGIITSAYTCLKPFENPRYLQLMLHSYDTYKLFYGLGCGVRQSLGYKDIRYIKVPLPPRDGQDQIVRYLDWKVSRINKLINAKRRQIELLKEMKQAIINTTINNINANSVLCRHLGAFQNGISESGEFFTEGFPFVNYSDVYNNIVLPETVSGKAKSNLKQQYTYSVEEGDIFFTRTSETINEVGLTSVCFKTIKKAVFSGFVIRMRPKKNLLNNTYAKYYFRSQRVRDYFIKEMNLVTRASLGQTLLKNLPVLLPSMKEQLAVGKNLDIQCKKIDYLISAIQKQIFLFHEYRNRLISDAVTGRIDVRDVVVPEYETMEETANEEFLDDDDI